jgi:hypothetical protein
MYNILGIAKEAGSTPPNSINVPNCPNRDTCSWTCNSCHGPGDKTGCINWNDVGITFDDGPTEYTPQVLKVLRDMNIKASFFVVGAQILRYPQILKQIHDDGHQIGMIFSH